MEEAGTFQNYPVLTIILLSITLLITIINHVELLEDHKLLYHLNSIIYEKEYWRLITGLLYIGPINLNLFFHLFMFYKYLGLLESRNFERKLDEFSFMILFGSIVLLIIGSIFKIRLLGPSLNFMAVYLWSKYNPNVRASIFGLITIDSIFLAPSLLLIQFLTTGKIPFNDIIGLIAGHSYYYLMIVAPKTIGIEVLKLPLDLWKKLFSYSKDLLLNKEERIGRKIKNIRQEKNIHND